MQNVKLSLIERSALRRVALGRGDLVPVARLYAVRLETFGLVRVLIGSRLDRQTGRLASCEVWAVITDRGLAESARLDEERRRAPAQP